jgi:hypothetical protein
VGIALVLTALGAVAAAGFESDPFLALEVEIADSEEAINEYVNAEIQVVLDRVSSRKVVRRCEELPPRIFRHLFAHLLSSRFKHFLEHSPKIERFPADDVGYWQHLNRSIYRRPIFPYILPLSSIIEVGGVRIGVDKFGHMFGEGRRYYRLYLRAVGRGIEEDDVLRRVVLKRLRWEKILLGGLSDGILSFADLEANYQGLEMARAMCEEPEPNLRLRAGKWRLERPIRIVDYVVPALDEFYYPNRFPRGRWKRVRAVLETEYCGLLENPGVQRRLERYRSEDQPSLSHQVIEEYFASRNVGLDEHSLQAVCSSPGTRAKPVTSMEE